MKQGKWLLSSAIVIALGLGSSLSHAADKVVAIGYQAPFTGEFAQYGLIFRNSANQAVDEFNKAHRLPGVKVELKFGSDHVLIRHILALNYYWA